MSARDTWPAVPVADTEPALPSEWALAMRPLARPPRLPWEVPTEGDVEERVEYLLGDIACGARLSAGSILLANVAACTPARGGAAPTAKPSGELPAARLMAAGGRR